MNPDAKTPPDPKAEGDGDICYCAQYEESFWGDWCYKCGGLELKWWRHPMIALRRRFA